MDLIWVLSVSGVPQFRKLFWGGKFLFRQGKVIHWKVNEACRSRPWASHSDIYD